MCTGWTGPPLLRPHHTIVGDQRVHRRNRERLGRNTTQRVAPALPRTL